MFGFAISRFDDGSDQTCTSEVDQTSQQNAEWKQTKKKRKEHKIDQKLETIFWSDIHLASKN